MKTTRKKRTRLDYQKYISPGAHIDNDVIAIWYAAETRNEDVDRTLDTDNTALKYDAALMCSGNAHIRGCACAMM